MQPALAVVAILVIMMIVITSRHVLAPPPTSVPAAPPAPGKLPTAIKKIVSGDSAPTPAALIRKALPAGMPETPRRPNLMK